jgi:hypothetical protein
MITDDHFSCLFAFIVQNPKQAIDRIKTGDIVLTSSFCAGRSLRMEMPKVMECSVGNCAYNTMQTCHAMAITVGEPDGDPACDTYFVADRHGGVKDMTAGVGACKLAECKFNTDYECSASSIKVGMHEGQADCLTYELK